MRVQKLLTKGLKSLLVIGVIAYGLTSKMEVKAVVLPNETQGYVSDANLTKGNLLDTESQVELLTVFEKRKDTELYAKIQEQVEKEEERLSNQRIVMCDKQKPIIQSDVIDENYRGAKVKLSSSERDLLGRIIQGETGGNDLEAAELVAQVIRDSIVYKGCKDVAEVISRYQYSGSTAKQGSDIVNNAIEHVFDNGEVVIQHQMYFFYAPRLVESKFHESQEFIFEYGGHRYFDYI